MSSDPHISGGCVFAHVDGYRDGVLGRSLMRRESA